MSAPAPTPPRRIAPLSTLLANQIAAGEVVERPASVVKELLENAIDAGATELMLEVEEGGKRLIRLRDNGSGIHPDDLALALSRHATSKIHTGSDLARVATLGFRGEALASIASVSRLTLSSRQVGQESGWRIVGEESTAPRPCAHPVGTTLEVRELFYNTPARRKFLRAERTEFNHVEEVVRRIALSRFDLALHLQHNGRTVWRLPRADESGAKGRRIARLLGNGFERDALCIDFNAAGLRLHGWLLAPYAARAQNDIQHLFLNGRVIRDRLVTHALRQAHTGWIDDGRHPGYLLYLELDPAAVDVNVHPTKHEVRFREARLVHDFLLRAVESALATPPEAPLLLETALQMVSPALDVQVPPSAAPQVTVVAPPLHASGGEGVQTGVSTSVRTPAAARQGQGRALFPPPRPLSKAVDATAIAEQSALYRLPPRPRPTSLPGTLLACLTRWLCAWRLPDGELLIIDRRELARAIAALQVGLVGGDTLPVPRPLYLSRAVWEALADRQEVLAQLGLACDLLGEGQLLVRAVPRGYSEAPLEALVQRLALTPNSVEALRAGLIAAAPVAEVPSDTFGATLQEWLALDPEGVDHLTPPLGRRLRDGELHALFGLGGEA